MHKYEIIFSIPVHEQPNVIIDQLINFKIFNPNCAIVIHISSSFNITADDLKLLYSTANLLGDIYINPNRVETGLCKIIKAHLVNYEYVKNMDFEYFAFAASNELFVKKGLYNYIKQFDCVECGNSCHISTPSGAHWLIQTNKALQDRVLIERLNKLGFPYIFQNQVEGSFYKKNIFNNIYNCINSLVNENDNDLIYAREEIYLHTFCAFLDRKYKYKKGINYTYINWDNNLLITKKDIKKLHKSNNNYYSVKRVERRINDSNRLTIRNIGKYYEIEKGIVGSEIQKKEHFRTVVKRAYRKAKKVSLLLMQSKLKKVKK